MPHTLSPLRFPGGKTKLYDQVRSIIQTNNLTGCEYAEPFTGGAGLALKLLFAGDVSRLHLNDLDNAVYSLWYSILNHPDEMCDFVNEVPLTIEEWKIQRETYIHKSSDNTTDLLTLGKAALFMNRTNRSGVLSGGVIGGQNQDGTYKIDARFTRSTLTKKINSIAALGDKISLTNLDASVMAKTVLPNIDNLFTYFDPPYVKKGPLLYRNCFSAEDHEDLSKTIKALSGNWIVTYDRCELIENLYREFDAESIFIGYSAGKAKQGEELIVYSSSLKQPVSLLNAS